MNEQKIPVEALTRQRYNGVWYTIGECFEVESESELADMEASRPPLVKRARRTYETRTMSIASAGVSEEQAKPAAVAQPARNGKYDRRDLRAR